MDWLYVISDRLNTYFRATDIPVSILGPDGALMNAIGPEGFSTAASNVCGRSCPCAEARAMGCGEAEQADRAFRCPANREFFSLPSKQRGKTRAVILAGPIPANSDPQKNRYLRKLLAAVTESIPAGDESSLPRSAEEREKINDYIDMLQDSYDLDHVSPTERRLIEDVISGDREHARTLLNETLRSIYHTAGQNFVMIRMHAIDLIALLSKALAENGMDPENVYRMSENAMNEIMVSTDLTDFSYRILEILDSFVSSAFARYPQATSSAIKEAIIFISEHFNENISRQNVADHVAMNASYFSSLFKRIMGTSFSEYLTEKRISQAKMMLKHGNTAIAEIAAAVGYENQSYFSRVFKSQTGMSPNQYRHS